MFSWRDRLVVIGITFGTIACGMAIGATIGSLFHTTEIGAIIGCFFSFPLAQFLLVRELKRRYYPKV